MYLDFGPDPLHVVVDTKSDAITLLDGTTNLHLLAPRHKVDKGLFEVWICFPVSMLININFECFDTGLAEAVVFIFVSASQSFVFTPDFKLLLVSFEVSIRARDAVV